jgi:hypothetical protein
VSFASPGHRATAATRSRRLEPLRPLLLAWGALLALELVIQPYRVWRHPVSDWLGFMTGGRMVHDGLAHRLYDLDLQQHVQAAAVGPDLGERFWNYANPPLFAWLLQPFAVLSPGAGAAAFATVAALSLVAALAVLAWLLPRNWAMWLRIGVAAAAGITVPMVDGVAGQITPVLMLFLAAAALRLRRHGDSLVAGLLLGALVLKPQLVWLLPPLLLLIGGRRTLTGLALAAAGWAASGFAVSGVDGMEGWAGSFLHAGYVDPAAMGAGLPGLAARAGVPASVAFAGSVAVAVAAVALLARRRAVLRADPALCVALGVALGTMCSPHAFDRDLALVGVALVLSAPWRPMAAVAAGFALGVTSLLDGYAQVLSPNLSSYAALAAIAVAWPARSPQGAPAVATAPPAAAARAALPA